MPRPAGFNQLGLVQAFVDSAGSLSSASPTVPIEASTPGSGRCWVNRNNVYWAAGAGMVHKLAIPLFPVVVSLMQSPVDHIEDEIGFLRHARFSAGDPAGEHVDSERGAPCPPRSPRR